MNETGLLTAEQAADYLQISLATLYEKTSNRKIPHNKVGKLLRFRKSELDRWIETKSVPVN